MITNYILSHSENIANYHILSVNWRHIRLIDLVFGKGENNQLINIVSQLSLIRQCFKLSIYWYDIVIVMYAILYSTWQSKHSLL